MMNGNPFDTTEVRKMFAGFTFPGFDGEALMASQRKNLAALTQANQLAVQGFQELAKRQVEFVSTAMNEASALVRGWSETGTTEERLQNQVAVAKRAFSQGVSNTRELVELAGKMQAEAFDVLNKRFAESLVETASFATSATETGIKNGTKMNSEIKKAVRR
jgi:phasin family protein